MFSGWFSLVLYSTTSVLYFYLRLGPVDYPPPLCLVPNPFPAGQHKLQFWCHRRDLPPTITTTAPSHPQLQPPPLPLLLLLPPPLLPHLHHHNYHRAILIAPTTNTPPLALLNHTSQRASRSNSTSGARQLNTPTSSANRCCNRHFSLQRIFWSRQITGSPAFSIAPLATSRKLPHQLVDPQPHTHTPFPPSVPY